MAGPAEQAAPAPAVRPGEAALLASVFIVAACGLVYELGAGALASYLLGDSVLQFSTVIGAYLFAMGLGAWAARHVGEPVAATFVRTELLVGLVGGLMPALLFLAHASLPASGGLLQFRVLLYGLVGVVGIAVGLEIPLVVRLLSPSFGSGQASSRIVSQVLSVDYLGALAVSIAFPLLLVPHLGLVRAGLLFGLLNAAVAAWSLHLFRDVLGRVRGLAIECAAVIAVLLAGLAAGDQLTTWAEDRFYGPGIVLRETTPYQHIVISAQSGHVRLFLNGNLQFNSRDEYRYHEALVHPAMAAFGAPRRVLVLGGGDGMALREILRYPSVQQVTLVELDPRMTQLFSTLPMLTALNGNALQSHKLRLINADAFTWLEQNPDAFDVIVVDFPDPSNYALGKLYSTSFYELLDNHLAASGYAVIQTTSPLVARRSFWTVAATLEAVGLHTVPYHANVPSFGEWGYILASRRPWQPPRQLPAGLRFLTPDSLPTMMVFPPDMARVAAEPNRLSNQVLVRTFEDEWGRVHD